jgi:hypothetical protein
VATPATVLRWPLPTCCKGGDDRMLLWRGARLLSALWRAIAFASQRLLPHTRRSFRSRDTGYDPGASGSLALPGRAVRSSDLRRTSPGCRADLKLGLMHFWCKAIPVASWLGKRRPRHDESPGNLVARAIPERDHG